MRRALVLVLMFTLLVFSAAGRTPQEPVEFAGLLQMGSTYRGQISYDKEQGWRTVVKLRVPYHHAARIEWVNLNEYPALDKPVEGAYQQTIEFEMVSRHVVKMPGQDRWNTTYRCRITALEP